MTRRDHLPVFALRRLGSLATACLGALSLAAGTVLMPTSMLLSARPARAAESLSLKVIGIDASNFPQVTAYLDVLNEIGQPVLGLGPDRFQVSENGVTAQDVAATTLVNAQEPLGVSILIDVSGSMDEKAMNDARSAAAAFIGALGERDQVSLISFATRVTEVQSATDNREALGKALAGLKPGGNTALYDALYQGVDAAVHTSTVRRLVVLETDGQDTSSRARLDDGINLARAQGVPVYTIGLGRDLDRGILDRIAASTGGTALYAATSGELAAAYRSIIDRLRSQYQVRYQSPSPRGSGDYRLSFTATDGSNRASAEASFRVELPPPVITGLSLPSQEALVELATLSIATDSARPVVRAWAEVNGKQVGQSATPPFNMTIDPWDLPAGPASLTVHILDSAGNEGTARIAVGAGLPPAGEQEPSPELAAPVRPPQEQAQLFLFAAAVVLSAALSGLQVRRLIGLVRSRRALVTCPACGTRSPAYAMPCPVCWARQAAATDSRDLCALLVENGAVTEAAVAAAREQSGGRWPIEQVLVEQGVISTAQLERARFYLTNSREMLERRRKSLAVRRPRVAGHLLSRAMVGHLTLLIIAAAVLGISVPVVLHG